MKKQHSMICMLMALLLAVIFFPATGAEAFRGSFDRGGTLVDAPGQSSPGQPPSSQSSPGQTAPAPSQPGTGNSRFSPSDRYIPAPLPPGGGSGAPPAPTNPTPGPPPADPPKTPAVPAAPSWLNANEAKGYMLLNEARIKNNQPPVAISYQLTQVARMKAQDMVDNNYFSHTSPTYGSLGTMLRNAGVSFKVAAENLSKAGNITQCHLQLEFSTKGHRQVMLNPGYKKVGVAVLPLKNVPGILMVQIYTD